MFLGFGNEDLLRVFTIYGHGSDLDQLSCSIWTKIPQPHEAKHEIGLQLALQLQDSCLNMRIHVTLKQRSKVLE